jgi:Domain of unknown function (DUF222)/HNH endonuclease
MFGGMTAVMESSGTPSWSLNGEATLAELDALHDTLTRLTARRLELLRHLDELGHAKDLGARDTAELLSLRHRLDPHVVRRDLRTAHALARFHTVACRLPGTTTDDRSTALPLSERRQAQLRETVLNPAQAMVITEILDKAPPAVRPDDLAVAQSELVIAARTLLPRDLKRLGTGVLNALDPDGPPPRDPVPSDEADRSDPTERAHAAQSLWFIPGTATDPTGMGDRVRGLRFGGFLTGEHAELFQVLIDAAAKPRKTPTGELDPRTLGQRRADAFTTILRAAAATGGEIPTHGGIKPHLSITIPYAALTRASLGGSAEARNVDVEQRPAAQPVGVTAGARATTGELVFGEPLPASDVRRIACDAGIIPIVLGSNSEPLDVGREHRLVTPPIRRALIARDGGCVIPGCDAPPGHCDAHHLIHWTDGGTTTVGNLALVCPPHHRAVHRGTWHLTVTNGQVGTTRPPWADPPQSRTRIANSAPPATGPPA